MNNHFLSKKTNWAFPNVWIVKYHESLGIHTISDQDGTMPTHEQMADILDKLKQAYQLITPEEINTQNAKVTQEGIAPASTAKKTRALRCGFIYLIADGCGLHKIGMSKNTAQRLVSLQCCTVKKLRIIHTVQTSDMVGLEAYFHEKFKTFRVSGEWFELTESAIAEFINYEKAIAL